VAPTSRGGRSESSHSQAVDTKGGTVGSRKRQSDSWHPFEPLEPRLLLTTGSLGLADPDPISLGVPEFNLPLEAPAHPACDPLPDSPHTQGIDINKATGWMLREAGKKDASRLRRFLDNYAPTMPRTMLRYALEKFEPKERKRYMAMK
jgi:hypothetical protein